MSQMRSILYGGTMVPIIEQDYILLLGYSILYKECIFTRFNHQKTGYSHRAHVAPLPLHSFYMSCI